MEKNEKKIKGESQKPTPQERSTFAQKEIQQILRKYNCSMLARPIYRYRDDNTWSLITNIEIIPNQGE